MLKTEGKASELMRAYEGLSGTTREDDIDESPREITPTKTKLLRMTRVSLPIIKRHRKPAGSPTIWLLAPAQQEREAQEAPESRSTEDPPGYCWCVLLLAKALHPSP